MVVKTFIKVIAAGITAIIILSGIAYFYYNTPLHVQNPNGNTDYVWQGNSRWMHMTEGVSKGQYDANGYNNLQVISSPDILVLGSSHMEAANVMQDENVTFLLNQYLENQYTAYNMGISGHHFIKVCKYLPITMALYEREPRYIIIETSETTFSEDSVNSLLQGTVDFTPSRNTGVIAALQKIPFLRLAYHQLTGGLVDLFMPQKKSSSGQIEEMASAQTETDSAPYDVLFQYIGNVMKNYDTHLIIFYHASGILQEDGTVAYQRVPSVDIFANKCKEYGFSFLDMTETFEKVYCDEKKLPYGFITGSIGEGHLNADGHALIAEELVKLINEHEKVN